MARIEQATAGLEVELVRTTVTLRERPSASPGPGPMVQETAVYGESLYGDAVWGSSESSSRLAEIAKIISNGSLKLGERDLTAGARGQLRDAMILEAHAREGRDVLVSNDAKGFISHGRQERLEELCKTRIMTVEEFCDYAEALGAGQPVHEGHEA